MIAGALAGLAGMLMCFRLLSAQASIGQSWLLPSIAAPVIGGMVSSLVHILIVTPVLYAWLREREMRKGSSAAEAPRLP